MKILKLIASLIIIFFSSSARCQKINSNSRLTTSTDIFDELQTNAWYLPTADHSAKLYVTSMGRGSEVIVLHGGPGNDFNYLVEPLSKSLTNHKFILFDQRGSLLSPVPDSLKQTLSIDKLIEDLETLRKSLKKDKITIFAHSFGTFLAMSYFIKYPEHVSGMVLSATLPPYTTSNFTLSDFAKMMKVKLNALRSRPEVKRMMAQEGVLNDSSVTLTPQQQSKRFKIDGLASFNLFHMERWNKFQGGRVYYNSQVATAIGNSMADIYDIRPALKKFPVPIAVIQGDKDYVSDATPFWLEMRTTHPLIRVFLIKGASHYSWIDDPIAFSSALYKSLGLVRSFGI